jgi:hypothetical protein
VSELAVHPVAALFPMLADDDLDELAADIKARGLLQPIVLDAGGRVLDGRNRLAACEKAGIEPDFITYADGDPDGYALAINISRRHLKPGARHLITEMARWRRTAMGGNPPGLFGQPQRKLESIRQISVMLPLSSISASTAISAMTF